MKNVSRQPNRLIHEKSPYLLQHAYNPVDWYPWGEEALRKAREEGKPILLSIGYATCHWCHVMEKESFEDEEMARIMNEHFVCVKVDREERPDLDEVHMKAVQAMTGQGGWPLTVFLTPTLKPFFGGTYFPPLGRHGLPGFKDVLLTLAQEWRKGRRDIETSAQRIMEVVRKSYEAKATEGVIQGTVLDHGYEQLVVEYDQEYGGFGRAPKFPLPTYLLFLLRYHRWKEVPLALRMVTKTLFSMARGGIYDQLGGGFHRYATDRRWMIPHFEKMLYDNALLARAYLEGYQVSREPFFAQVARETLEWALREMRDGGGGFYSAQDADSEGGEGVFYAWKPEEVNVALGGMKAEAFCRYYGVQPGGNFEEASVLHVAREPGSLAAELGLSLDQLEDLLKEGRQILFQNRLQRPRPLTDDKILTELNGLMISALAFGYQLLGDPRYLKAGEEAAHFILDKLERDGRLFRRYREGEAAILGTLNDYAFFAMGLLDLYEASFRVLWLNEAIRITQDMVSLFRDEDGGGFLLNSGEQNELGLEIKDAYDGPTPSGNSVAALNLLRVAELTGDEELRRRAEKTVLTFWERLEAVPTAHTQMLCAVHFYLAHPKQIVVAGNLEQEETQEMLREIRQQFIPEKVVALAPQGGVEETPHLTHLIAGKTASGGKPTVYICENYSCKVPITELEGLRRALSTSAASPSPP